MLPEPAGPAGPCGPCGPVGPTAPPNKYKLTLVPSMVKIVLTSDSQVTLISSATSQSINISWAFVSGLKVELSTSTKELHISLPFFLTLVVTSSPLAEPVILVKSKTYIPETWIVNLPLIGSQPIFVKGTFWVLKLAEFANILNSSVVAGLYELFLVTEAYTFNACPAGPGAPWRPPFT